MPGASALLPTKRATSFCQMTIEEEVMQQSALFPAGLLGPEGRPAPSSTYTEAVSGTPLDRA
jgi:hypothetical protein